MTDDKIERDDRDASKIARFEDYEVSWFAGRHQIPVNEARELIAKQCNDRETRDLVVRKPILHRAWQAV